jgi:hypothetical protein
MDTSPNTSDLVRLSVTTENLAAERLARDVTSAKSALLGLAATDPERWWRAVELKTRARNDRDPGAMSIAMAQLIDEGHFEIGARLEIRLVSIDDVREAWDDPAVQAVLKASRATIAASRKSGRRFAL